MRNYKAKSPLLRALTLLAAAAPALAWAEPTCAWVIGHVGGQTVSTPAVVVYVPDSSAEIQPVRVHVDPINETILGYSVRGPGADYETDKQSVFVQGVNQPIDPIVATIPQLNFQPYRCIDQGVSTPAIPVYVPGSALITPGVVVEVPRIELNAVGHPITTEGWVIQVPSKTVCIPDMTATVPGVSWETPDLTLQVWIDGTGYPTDYLPSN